MVWKYLSKHAILNVKYSLVSMLIVFSLTSYTIIINSKHLQARDSYRANSRKLIHTFSVQLALN